MKKNYRNASGKIVNKIINHVEINPIGELINPQTYDNEIRVVGNIIFELAIPKLNVYDMYHKLVSSIDLVNPSKETEMRCIGEQNFGQEENDYYILIGNRREYAK